MEFLQQIKRDILKFGIKTPDGVDTGEHIEIDLEDPTLPMRIVESEKLHKESIRNYQMQMNIIKKKQDSKKKNELFSKNELAIIELENEFMRNEEKAIDLVYGDGATRKLLHGGRPYLTMFFDLTEMLEPVKGIIGEHAKNKEKAIKDKIRNTYKLNNEEEDVL